MLYVQQNFGGTFFRHSRRWDVSNTLPVVFWLDGELKMIVAFNVIAILIQATLKLTVLL